MIGRNHIVEFIDADGYKYHTSIYSFIRVMESGGDLICFRIRKTNIFSIDNIKLWLIINKKNFHLISNEFINACAKLDFYCDANHFFSMCWNHVMGGQICPSCAGYCLSDKNRLSIVRPDIAKEWNYKRNVKTPYDYSYGSSEKVWWVCEQGHEWKSSINSRTGMGTCCPGCNESRGEKVIRIILLNENILFIPQIAFDDCRNIYPLQFDFGIEIEGGWILIEYDGQQHFEPREFFGGQESFEYLHKCDNIKDKYCYDNNIPLYRIPYTEKDNIESIVTNILYNHNLLQQNI
jgi:hypothetical protein